MERDQIIERLGVNRPLSRSKQEILAVGASVVPLLISILVDEDLDRMDHPGCGWPPVHAAALLGELRAEAAIAPLLGALCERDASSLLLHAHLIPALSNIGAAVVEPTLEAYAKARDEELRTSLASVLAECGSRDDRIYQLLVSRFEAGLDRGGGLLAAYRDVRALPLLQRAYDELRIVEDDAEFANHILIDLKDGIEELGGTLTVAQEAKFEIAMAPVRSPAISSALPPPAMRVARPGRNEPCWCGSEKKYKKCHLEADDLAALRG